MGMAVGLAVGSLLAHFFAKVHIRDTAKVLIILSISFLLVAAEDALTTAITFSALIAIMFIGIGQQKKRAVVAKRLSVKYGKLWVAAEVFLFVLVGATVNIGYLGKVGAKALLLIVGALAFRMLGVFVCLLGTSLSKKERLFAMMACTPQGNRAGCHWRHSAGTGLCLRRYRAYRGGAGHRADGSTWCLCHGSEL